MKYPVTTPVRHDGKDYAPGDQIDLDARQAEALLAAGAIAEPQKVEQKKHKDEK